MSKALATPNKRILPSKEATLFKELLTLYETRQLKKGLKTADQILKKFPEHGESLCMKGLVLTHMGRREEGIELVKKGVRLDLTSHIVWHVFGLIQKGEKNYEEALKSYTQALRFDKENLNILRDAAQLQTQLRHYDALVDTRHTLLKLRPTLRQHWIGLAVAYHLNRNLPEAKRTLEHYERTLKNIPNYDVEHSETLLYHIHILEETEEFAEALAFLDLNDKSHAIVDRTAVIEIRARLLSKLKSDKAESAWRTLIEHNPDCYDYYHGYLANRGLTIGQNTQNPEALIILQDLSTQLPRAAAPRRLALSVSPISTFPDLAKPYLLTGLTKGIPSLFVDIKSLYSDDSKRRIVEEIVEAIRLDFAPSPSSIFSSNFPSPSIPASTTDPTTYLWALYFLAQHYSYLSRPSVALSLIEIALTHTPTLPELHTCKARICKRAGNPYGAIQCMDEARLLDGQDRFLNTKCAKYLLRAGYVSEAEKILGLFTKKDATSPGTDLEDMQSLLYLAEDADAHYRNGKLNLALKKYMTINKVFNEIEDDQYDFHGYNLRKFTINAYLNLVKWEDRLRSHPAYIKAAISASQIYVAIHDDPTIASSSTPLTDADKKAKKKAKKAAQRVQEDKKAPTPSVNEDKGLEIPSPKDDDPEGLKLISVADPLEQAAKLLSPLANLTEGSVDIWIAIYDVAIRRRKLLQAVRALNKAHDLNPDHPEVHIRLVHFRKTMSSLPQQPPAPIGPTLAYIRARLLPSEAQVSLDTYNTQYLQRHSSSALAIFAAAKVAHTLLAPIQEVERILFTTLEKGLSVTLDISIALAITEFLGKIKAPRLEEFRRTCDERFKLSTVFKPVEELEVLRKRAVTANEIVEENGSGS